MEKDIKDKIRELKEKGYSIVAVKNGVMKKEKGIIYIPINKDIIRILDILDTDDLLRPKKGYSFFGVKGKVISKEIFFFKVTEMIKLIEDEDSAYPYAE